MGIVQPPPEGGSGIAGIIVSQIAEEDGGEWTVGGGGGSINNFAFEYGRLLLANDFEAFIRIPFIPVSGPITTALLFLTGLSAPGGQAPASTLFGDDVDNAVAPTPADDPDTFFTPTTASVAIVGPTMDGVRYTLDVTPIVNEILGRAGWAPGNALQFFTDGAPYAQNTIANAALVGSGQSTVPFMQLVL